MHDYKLAIRILLKYPGLTIAGGLALAVAIGIGAGWYDLWGKILAPTIPLPDGDRLVWVETHNTLTSEPETRVVHDFLEWRRELRTIEGLGAYRTDTRNLIVGNAAPEPIEVAQLTAAAFRAARVPPLIGRALVDSDETPGAASVVVLGYDVWQRSLGGRTDVVGSVVTLGDNAAIVIGVMPDSFRYPMSHDAWTPLQLRASYGPLEGGSITVIGRLAPGVTLEAANAELVVLAKRAADMLPATHEHLRPRATQLGATVDISAIAQLALTNLPGLLVLLIACMTVGTLVYARTATREAEIAVRSALGAGRARIVSQLFVEALVLASIAAAVGLIAADRTLRWGIRAVYDDEGGAPFWMTPGLDLTTVVFASGLAILAAGMLSVLPALKATRAGVQSHLSNLGTGGATLRFGRVWTSAMIMQVALTAMGIPVAMEGVSQAWRGLKIRAAFPSGDYLAARIDVDQPFETEATSALEEQRAQTFAALEQRIAEEPGVVAVTFADRAPGTTPRSRVAQVESSTGAGAAHAHSFRTSAVGPGFFEAFDIPIVAGRAFHGGDRSPAARTVIVNEAFARDYLRYAGSGSPLGARLLYSEDSARSSTSPAQPWFEIVGVVRDFGLDPDDEGNEVPYVFHAASAGTVSPLAIIVRVRGNPGTLVARLPLIAVGLDPRLYVEEVRTLDEWIRRRDFNAQWPAAAGTAVSALVLFLSAMGIFSLMSVTVSRRTREIGLRAALGANQRQLLGGILSRAILLVGSGIAAGGALLLWAVALAGPTGRPAEDMLQFSVWLGATTAVILTAGLLACLEPARRVLKINPSEALREA